jgi:hypothetical protein
MERASVALCGVLVAAGTGLACSTHNVRGKMLEVGRDTAVAPPIAVVVGTQPVVVDSIEYSGTNNGWRTRWPPFMVQVSVHVKNIGQQPVRLEVLGGNCAVRVKIYSASAIAQSAHDLSAVRPVFDATEEGFQCYVRSLYLALASGHDTTLQSVSGPGVRLLPGRYDLVGIVTVIPSADSLRRHGPTIVAVPAGSIRVPQPFD